MKQFKHILAVIILSAVSFSCSDNLEMDGIAKDYVPDGYLKVEFTVPELEHIMTRGNQNSSEMKINNLILFIFSSDGLELLQREEVDETTLSSFNSTAQTSNTFSYVFRLSNQTEQLMVYAVANTIMSTGDLLSGFKTGEPNTSVGDLESFIYSRNYDKDNGFFMSGQTVISDNKASLNLNRTAAKLTLKDISNNTSFELTGFTVTNIADNCYITAGSSTTNNIYIQSATKSVSASRVNNSDGSFRYDCYANPTKTYQNSNNHIEIKSYVIIKGKFNNVEGYYAVPLYDSLIDEYYDIEPNHWYEMQISNVSSPGYSTQAQALANPSVNEVDYEIHDHSINVLSMVTDGIHELGVGQNITIVSSASTFVVRLFDRNHESEESACSHYPVLQNISQGVTKHTGENYSVEVLDNWLTLTKFQDISNVSSESQESANESIKESEGKRYQYTINVNADKSFGGEQTGTIIVRWQGLERRITVKSFSTFNAQVFSAVTLIMHDTDNNGKYDTTNYWEWLSGKQVNITSKGDCTLYGVDEASMSAEKVRNEGLHFPIMYGEDSTNPWWYEYYMSVFSSLVSKVGGKFFSVSVRENGVEINDAYSTWGTDKLKFEKITKISGNNLSGTPMNRYERYPVNNTGGITFIVKRCLGSSGLETGIPDDFDYSIAEMVVTIFKTTDETEQGEEFVFNLYHTGFFHYFYSRIYHYYEVVPMGNYHWLDRNLGATSNKMYVDDGSSAGVGKVEAKGRFYTIAIAGDPNSLENADPKVNDIKFCPPGFHVPNITEWDDVIMSPNFTSQQETDNGKSYISNFYQSPNKNVGKIYFPKVRYANDNNRTWTLVGDFSTTSNMGDNSSGYYWTRTAASGLEKLQIGQWLSTLNISGSSSNYINGNVKGNRMSVRCVANRTGYDPDKETKHPINFNVKGATHVFLYSTTEGTKNGIFSFPGKPIGSQSAVDALDYDGSSSNFDKFKNSYLHFSYSSSLDPESLYVFFAYQTDDGRISIISRNGSQTVKGATGWPVKNGYNYFFDLNNNFAAMAVDNAFPWLADGVTDNNQGKESYFKITDQITIYWPDDISGADMWRIYGWDEFGNEFTTGFPGDKYSDFILPGKEGNPFGESHQSYYYSFSLTYECDKFYVIFNRGSSSVQTNNIEISRLSNYCDITKNGDNIEIIMKNLSKRN